MFHHAVKKINADDFRLLFVNAAKMNDDDDYGSLFEDVVRKRSKHKIKMTKCFFHVIKENKSF